MDQAASEAPLRIPSGVPTRSEAAANEAQNERTWSAGMTRLPQMVVQRLMRQGRSNPEDSAQADSSLAASSDPLQNK